MFSTAIIIFRETIEIAMILGVVLLATRDLPKRLPWIAAGLAAGVCGAGLVALFTQSLGEAMDGVGQEIFNAAVLFSAAIMIGWTVLWMRKHAREMAAQLKKVGQDVTSGNLPLYSLSLIIGLSMLREGAEMVMFIYGMIVSGQSSASIISGSLFGLSAGSAVGVMLYFGLLKMPARYALSVTSWLLVLLVAGLTSKAAGYLSAAGYFADFSESLWDSSWLLSQESILGQTLHNLVGYNASPSAIQLAFYVLTLSLLLLLMGFERKGKTAGFPKAA